jgi:hypothetical protein
VSVSADGTWSHEQDTVLKIIGNDQLFHHTDAHLHKVAEATPNWMMRQSSKT